MRGGPVPARSTSLTPSISCVVCAAQGIDGVREVDRAGTGPPRMPPDERREGETARERGASGGREQRPAATPSDRQGDGGEAEDPECGGEPPPAAVHEWLMRLAAAAAPNPLSMFTTVTPEAQELSMASSAASPPKEAPYPTLVGTAITGTLTSPPTTLGSAPSIPATTMITAALRRASVWVRKRWMPATPTSVSRSTRLRTARAVTAASSATGRSLVPAVTTSTEIGRAHV